MKQIGRIPERKKASSKNHTHAIYDIGYHYCVLVHNKQINPEIELDESWVEQVVAGCPKYHRVLASASDPSSPHHC